MAHKKTYGFSMKRLTGVTDVKKKISKATGIPTTKQGRRNKTRRLATGGGCLVSIILLAIGIILVIMAF